MQETPSLVGIDRDDPPNALSEITLFDLNEWKTQGEVCEKKACCTLDKGILPGNFRGTAPGPAAQHHKTQNWDIQVPGDQRATGRTVRSRVFKESAFWDAQNADIEKAAGDQSQQQSDSQGCHGVQVKITFKIIGVYPRKVIYNLNLNFRTQK